MFFARHGRRRGVNRFWPQLSAAHCACWAVLLARPSAILTSNLPSLCMRELRFQQDLDQSCASKRDSLARIWARHCSWHSNRMRRGERGEERADLALLCRPKGFQVCSPANRNQQPGSPREGTKADCSIFGPSIWAGHSPAADRATGRRQINLPAGDPRERERERAGFSWVRPNLAPSCRAKVAGASLSSLLNWTWPPQMELLAASECVGGRRWATAHSSPVARRPHLCASLSLSLPLNSATRSKPLGLKRAPVTLWVCLVAWRRQH